MELTNNKKNNLHRILDLLSTDRISNLPNELIHRILSFLPTKCAISTCVLSKRFNYVSSSIRTLDFRNFSTLCSYSSTSKQLKQETKNFMNFLDTVLYHHDKHNIQKFYLSLGPFFDICRVRKWINTVIKRRVEEFGIYIHHPSTLFIFPRSFFTCNSFTLLDLQFNESKFSVPEKVSFPNLKKLQLKFASFENEASNRKFFSNCPILEELTLITCWMSEGLSIVNSALKHLFITNCSFGESMVEISAPNLLTISYKGGPPADFVLNNIPSLVDADVDFDFDDGYNYPVVFVKFFKKLSSAKHLKISAFSFEVLSRDADILSSGSLTFNNLIKLEIFTQSAWIYGLDSLSKVRALFKFLQLSPNLESIIFAESVGIPDEDVDGFLTSFDPKYSLPHLKSIKLTDFYGEPAELNAIKIFLKYVSSLEIVTIVASPVYPEDLHKRLAVLMLLLKFPRPANCVVDVLYEA